jgi:hypothetical protein
MQIQLAQRAYVDGVFAFIAVLMLWLLWENMRIKRLSTPLQSSCARV